MKLWIDEVFQYQFAYGSQGDKLKGKNFMLSFTAGGLEEAYSVSGKHHLRIYECCKSLENTAGYAQMKYIDPICLYGLALIAGITTDDIEVNARQYAQKLVSRLSELKE